MSGDKATITYGASRKISDNNYGSYEFHASISVESTPEKAKETLAKAIAFVEGTIKSKVDQGNQGKLPY